MFAQILIISSAALLLLIGLLHLQGSFFLFNKDLEPRDEDLKEQMKQGALKISPQTSLWRAWIGFNAMLAFGLLLFGLVFGYLALLDFAYLIGTPFLLWVGALYLMSLVVFSWVFLFYLPALAFTFCLILYGVGAAATVI